MSVIRPICNGIIGSLFGAIVLIGCYALIFYGCNAGRSPDVASYSINKPPGSTEGDLRNNVKELQKRVDSHAVLIKQLQLEVDDLKQCAKPHDSGALQDLHERTLALDAKIEKYHRITTDWYIDTSNAVQRLEDGARPQGSWRPQSPLAPLMPTSTEIIEP